MNLIPASVCRMLRMIQAITEIDPDQAIFVIPYIWKLGNSNS